MKRVISAVILIPAALLVVIYATQEIYFYGVAILGTLCLYEYCGLVRNTGIKIRTWFVIPIFLGLLVASFVLTHTAYRSAIAALTAVMLVIFIAAVWRPRLSIRERALALMAETLGVFYFSLFLYPVFYARFQFGDAVGLHWTILLLAVIWANDIAALAVGRKFGKTLFAPQLSPKKTNEGAAAGLIAGIVVAVVLRHFLFTGLQLVHVVAVSILTGVFGQLGDIAESLLKRAADVKDSSGLIPGHGGALDRMDSLLFAFPVLYIYLVFLY